jgi:hypothetical protein
MLACGRVGLQATHFRVHARRAIRLRASVIHRQDGWERDGQVLNLGLGGACVVLAAAGLVSGDHVTISFLAPTLWDPLAFPARVAWTLTPEPTDLRAGLAFEPTNPSTVYALFELLTTMSF